MEFEFQLRPDAIRLCEERGLCIQAALWNAHQNQDHRTKQFVQLLSVANSRSSGHGVGGAYTKNIEKLEREVAESESQSVLGLRRIWRSKAGETARHGSLGTRNRTNGQSNLTRSQRWCRKR